MPNPCHYQDYDRSMLYPAQSGSEGCSPKMCAQHDHRLIGQLPENRVVKPTVLPTVGVVAVESNRV